MLRHLELRRNSIPRYYLDPFRDKIDNKVWFRKKSVQQLSSEAVFLEQINDANLGDLNKVIKNKNIDLIVFYLCNMQCCMSVVGDNIMKTADMVTSIYKTANKLDVDVIFGGLGIELLPNVSNKIKKTFITFKELKQLV